MNANLKISREPAVPAPIAKDAKLDEGQEFARQRRRDGAASQLENRMRDPLEINASRFQRRFHAMFNLDAAGRCQVKESVRCFYKDHIEDLTRGRKRNARQFIQDSPSGPELYRQAFLLMRCGTPSSKRLDA